jgi:hypothetical protein
MLKVLVVDESRERAAEISIGLLKAGYQVAAVLPGQRGSSRSLKPPSGLHSSTQSSKRLRRCSKVGYHWGTWFPQPCYSGSAAI